MKMKKFTFFANTSEQSGCIVQVLKGKQLYIIACTILQGRSETSSGEKPVVPLAYHVHCISIFFHETQFIHIRLSVPVFAGSDYSFCVVFRRQNNNINFCLLVSARITTPPPASQTWQKRQRGIFQDEVLDHLFEHLSHVLIDVRGYYPVVNF